MSRISASTDRYLRCLLCMAVRHNTSKSAHAVLLAEECSGWLGGPVIRLATATASRILSDDHCLGFPGVGSTKSKEARPRRFVRMTPRVRRWLPTRSPRICSGERRRGHQAQPVMSDPSLYGGRFETLNCLAIEVE